LDYSLELDHNNYKDFKSIKNCVYRFISPSGKSYIGMTKNFYKRYNDHRNGHKQPSRKKTKFYDACKKYDFKDFKIMILVKDIEDEELLKFGEVLYIDKFKSQDPEFGYNMTPGGDGVRLFGEENGMYGKKHKPESIQKMKDNNRKMIGPDNAWHSSNKSKEELSLRAFNATKARLDNISKLSEEELAEMLIKRCESSKNIWLDRDNPNLQKSLEALRYWEYKSQEELQEINEKKIRKGLDNGRAKIFILESPQGDVYEVYLDQGLKDFCENNNLVFRALFNNINKCEVLYPGKHDTKFFNDEEYKYKRLNTIGWKIQSYRRKDYEINVR